MRRDISLHGTGAVPQIDDLARTIPGREDDPIRHIIARGIPLAAEAEGKQLIDRVLPDIEARADLLRIVVLEIAPGERIPLLREEHHIVQRQQLGSKVVCVVLARPDPADVGPLPLRGIHQIDRDRRAALLPDIEILRRVRVVALVDEVIVALQIGVARLLLRHKARADVPVGQMRHRFLRRDIAGLAKRQHRWQVARRCCLLRRLRVCQEADGQHDAEQNCNQGDPKGRLFIVQHPFHTLLHTYFAERQRTGQHRPSRRCAREQRGRIGLPLREAQLPHGPLVAGQLQIPAEAPVAEPAQRLEPVDRQQQIAQRLPPVVAPREMCPLVREDIVPRRAVQPRGQIDPRAKHAQNKRRGDCVAEPNILPQQRGLAHAPLCLYQPHERVEEQRRAARGPDEPGDLRPDVERIHAHRRIGAEIRLHQPLVDRAVQRRDAGRQLRHGVISNRILRERLCARHEAPRTLKPDRQHEPHRRKPPQQTPHPRRELFQHRPQDQ